MKINNLEDIYPLSPMQQGILFHSIYAPQSKTFHFQFRSTLQGNLDVSAFKQAWVQTVGRYAILRTGFFWEGLDEPLQVVRQKIRLPWCYEDWRNRSAEAQAEALQDRLTTDLETPFQLTNAPLMRFYLFQLGEETYHFTWSHHHLLLDGWSTPIVLQTVLEGYQHLTEQVTTLKSLEETNGDVHPPYQHYIAWLQEQDMLANETYWREMLGEINAATTLGLHQGDIGQDKTADNYETQTLTLSPQQTANLNTLAQQHLLTLNTIVQAAWLLVYHHYSGAHKLLIGVTVSGRGIDLPQIDKMVGVFINALPVRVDLNPDELLLTWLKDLQHKMAEVRQYEYTPQTQIQQWSQIPQGQPMYESTFVFANYPLEDILGKSINGLMIRDIDFFEKTNIPLSLEARPGPELLLIIKYDHQLFDGGTIDRLLQQVVTTLEQMQVHLNDTIGTINLASTVEGQALMNDFIADFD